MNVDNVVVQKMYIADIINFKLYIGTSVLLCLFKKTRLTYNLYAY